MSLEAPASIARADALRRAFDRSFAEAPRIDEAPRDDLLAIGIGPDPYAVRLRDVAGLWVDKAVTWIPGGVPGQLGLAALRGVILPVYDLRALLAYPRPSVPRWLLVASSSPVGLAFDRFDGHLRVPRDAVALGPAEAGHPHAREVVSAAGVKRPVLHMASVLHAIDVLVPRAGPRSGR